MPLLTFSRTRQSQGTTTTNIRPYIHGNGNGNAQQQQQHGTRFWLYVVCGVVCSFLSIDYSLRSLVQTAGSSSSSSATIATIPTASAPEEEEEAAVSLSERLLIPKQQHSNDYYAFDSTASITPDPKQHAILIPYRDRKFHLELFLEYMEAYLARYFPQDKFTLWVIEQDDAELFNRAWLANVGLREIVKHAPQTSCVVFHDVDLVPNISAAVPYNKCEYPIQLGSELQHFNWSVPYPAYCGGITSLSLKHWQLINGIGNDYIGWGGEDDDLYHRLRINGLLLDSHKKDTPPQPRRPAKGHGIFRTLTQKAEHHVQTKQHNQYWKTLELLKQMYENSDRWKYDGMNDVYYTITSHQISVPDMGFQQVRHMKAIPQKMRPGGNVYPKHHGADADKEDNNNNNNKDKPLANLEQVHVPYTGGQAITKAGAEAGIVWGACHYGAFPEWNCPTDGKSGDFALAPFRFEASYQEAKRPWHIPLSRFSENPMEGTKRFTVVRHPYSRAISFYRYMYDAQHGYPYGYKYHDVVPNKDYPPQHVAQYIIQREHPDKLNTFLQDYLYQMHHPHKHTGVELIPQVQYVYSRGVKFVHHVMHYEFLQRDFNNLMEKYTLSDQVTLPPPDRKRKRKKAVVKKYHEKRQPQPTKTWTAFFLGPLLNFLRLQEEQPVVVDMSLAEIEDEYLLGAQDLDDTTVAMLNDHFELDFKKFHYAKIKVNATTEQYWNKIQVIPRESAVAKQQAERNEMLKRQKSGGRGGGGAAAAPKPMPQTKPIPREPKEERDNQDEKKDDTASKQEDKQEEKSKREDKEEQEENKEKEGTSKEDEQQQQQPQQQENGDAKEEEGEEQEGGDNGANNNENYVDNLKKHAELQQQREDEEVGKIDKDDSHDGKEQAVVKEE